MILCLGVTDCATAVDPGTQIDSSSSGELTVGGEEVPRLPELPTPCNDDETAIYVDEGQCLKVTGYHSSPHHGRWWGGCATHAWNGLCDQQLVICVGEGSTLSAGVTERVASIVRALQTIGRGLQELGEALDQGKPEQPEPSNADPARLRRIRETLAQSTASITRALFDLTYPPQRVERRGPTVAQAVDRLVPRGKP